MPLWQYFLNNFVVPDFQVKVHNVKIVFIKKQLFVYFAKLLLDKMMNIIIL